MVSDSEILQKYKNSREEGIRLLFFRYYRPLVLYADEFTDSLPIAEDIVQEFFVRLWKDDYLLQLTPRALSSYLFTSVRNACYTHGHRKEVLDRRVELMGMDIPADTATEMNQQIVDRVMESVRKLPNQTQEVVIRILMQDMKYKEAAEELHISVNTLKTLLKNGLKMLREDLKDERNLLLFIFFKKKLSGHSPIFDFI